MEQRTKIFKVGLGLAISGALIFLIIRMVDWQTVVEKMKQAHLLPIAWITALWIFHFYMRAVRWSYLLPEGKKIPKRILFDSIMIGNFATFTVPLRAGEFIRPFFLSRNSSQPFAAGFISVVIERFFDLSMVLTLFSVVVMKVPSLPEWTRRGSLGLAAIAVGIFVFIIIGSLLPRQTQMIITRCTGFLPVVIQKPIQSFLQEFLKGTAVLRNFSSLFMISVLTAFIWTLNLISFYAFFSVLDIPGTPLLGLTLTVLVALAVAAPSAPGFVGIFQVGCIASFSLFGLSAETATAYSILNHFHQFVMFISYGLFILWRYGISLKELRYGSNETVATPS